MGLFSKKTYTCKQCGREYEARINLGGGLCSECQAELKEMEKAVPGYSAYGVRMGKPYSTDELRAAVRHRDEILEKYRISDGISKENLKKAGDNYKKLSEDEARSVYQKAMHERIFIFRGAYLTSHFIGLTDFEGTIVDMEDVFAAAYTSVRLSKDATTESIMSVAFTNDPYIPVFAMVTDGEVGLFSMKSKSGRKNLEAIFSGLCPNLAYPVMELKELKKTVKEEGSKGKISDADMLKYISDASSKTGLFTAMFIMDDLSGADLDTLYSYGYIPEPEIRKLLKMDKIFVGSFWEDIKKKSLFSLDLTDE